MKLTEQWLCDFCHNAPTNKLITLEPEDWTGFSICHYCKEHRIFSKSARTDTKCECGHPILVYWACNHFYAFCTNEECGANDEGEGLSIEQAILNYHIKNGFPNKNK